MQCRLIQFEDLFHGMNYSSEFVKVQAIRKMIYTSTLLIVLAAIVGAQSGENSSEGDSDEYNRPPTLHNFMMPGSKMREIKSKLKDEFHTCLHLIPPKDMMDVMKTCMVNVLKSPEVQEDFKSDEKSVRDMIKYIGEKYLACQMEEYELDMSGNDLRLEDLIEKMELDEWVGTWNSFTVQNEIVKKCIDSSTAETSKERVYEFLQCSHSALVDYCEEEDEDIGIVPAMQSLFLTAGDEPMCDSVEVPQEIFDSRVQCLKDAAAGVDVSVAVEAETSPLMKAYVLTQELFKKVCIPSVECMMEKSPLEEFNKDTRKFDMNSVIDYVKNLNGWEGITQKRDEITDAMSECSDVFDEEGSEEETKIETYKRLWAQFVEFDRCLIPKFANTCGINNKLVEALFPLFNKEFLKTNIEVIMQTGGVAVKEMLTFIKEKMGSMPM